MRRVLEETAKLYNASELVVLMVDIDGFQELGGQYGIKLLPTFILFRNTKWIKFIVGDKTKVLNESIRLNINRVNSKKDDERVELSTENSQSSLDNVTKVDDESVESSTQNSNNSQILNMVIAL
ncbi:thioredoxin-1-like [Sitodiplosis mosellana]|uniref:thioredoxin-1-like n=1 Tax=Sitodiplosis mosellana TaxID=263140 RepID=UPI002443EC11|nr:thioredoxin-1-like [Sitodiplosis mosellana]